VIATGFDKVGGQQDVFGRPSAGAPGVLPFPKRTAPAPAGPVQKPLIPEEAPAAPEVSEMEIPTFIRRQMD
jgi:hypothetical protein